MFIFIDLSNPMLKDRPRPTLICTVYQNRLMISRLLSTSTVWRKLVWLWSFEKRTYVKLISIMEIFFSLPIMEISIRFVWIYLAVSMTTGKEIWYLPSIWIVFINFRRIWLEFFTPYRTETLHISRLTTTLLIKYNKVTVNWKM